MFMKNISLLLILAVAISITTWSCKSQNKVEDKKIDLTSKVDSASYAIGMQIGQNFAQQGLDTVMNIDLIIAGLKDQIAKEAKLDINQTDQIVNDFFMEQQKAASAGKLKEGEDFYYTPEGYKCFTEKYHLKRGYCCKSGCRHCPYGFDKKTGTTKTK